MTIFVVTVLYLKDGAPDASSIRLAAELAVERRRCWGWFATLEDAEHAVLGNHTDMFEAGYYTHAVVEEMPEGLIPIAEIENWFEVSYAPGNRDPLVIRVAKPASMARTVGFGMG